MKGVRETPVEKRDPDAVKLGVPRGAQLPEVSRWAALAAFLTERPVETKFKRTPLVAVPGDDEVSVKTRYEEVLRGRSTRRVKA